jgi:hypothetical protein
VWLFVGLPYRDSHRRRARLHSKPECSSREVVRQYSTRQYRGSRGTRSSLKVPLCSPRWVGLALLLDDITCIDLDGRLRRSVGERERERTTRPETTRRRQTEILIKRDMDNTLSVRQASPSSCPITESLARVRGSLLYSRRRLSSFDPLGCHLHPPKHLSTPPPRLLQFVRSSASRPA